MAEQLAPKPTPSKKKDFYYYLPLIVSFFVNLFWLPFGLMLFFFAIFGSMFFAKYYPDKPDYGYVPFIPLIPLIVLPLSFIPVLFSYILKKSRVFWGKFHWLSLLYGLSLLLYLPFVNYFVLEDLGNLVSDIIRDPYILVITILWILALTSTFAYFLAFFKRKKK